MHHTSVTSEPYNNSMPRYKRISDVQAEYDLIRSAWTALSQKRGNGTLWTGRPERNGMERNGTERNGTKAKPWCASMRIPRAGSIANIRTDFSARESYEQQDAATGQRPNVGAVCVSIVQHSPTERRVKTYTKEVVSEDDAAGFARKVVAYAKGTNKEELKVTLEPYHHRILPSSHRQEVGALHAR